MALRTLKTSNARITPKVERNNGGALDDILGAIGVADKLAQNESNRQLLEKEEQLRKDQITDEAAIQETILNKGDLRNLELATEKGVESRDLNIAQQTNIENVRESELEGAKQGLSAKEIQARFNKKTQEDIISTGSDEEKRALIAKANASNVVYSNNAAEQEITRAKEEKADLDTQAVYLALDKQQPPSNFSSEQRKMWYEINATQDINAAVLENENKSVLNKWNTENQIANLRQSVDNLTLQYSDNPSYVNKLEAQFLEAEAKIRARRGADSVKRSNEIINNQEQVLSTNMLNSISSTEMYSSDLNNALSIGKISEDNLKASIEAELLKANTEQYEVPSNLMDFLKNNRPSGASGWAYSDESINRLLRSNANIMKSLGAEKDKVKPSEYHIAQHKSYLDDKVEKGTLTKNDIESETSDFLLTKTQRVDYYGKLIEQTEQEDANMTLSTALESNNPILIKNFETSFNNEQVQKAVNHEFEIHLNNEFPDVVDNNYSLEQVLAVSTKSFSSPKVMKMMENGYMPDILTNSLNVDPSNNFELFINNAQFLDGYMNRVGSNGVVDTDNRKIIEGAIGVFKTQQYETAIELQKKFPDMTEQQIVSNLNKQVDIKHGYNSQVFPEMGSKDYNKMVTDVVDDLQGVGIFDLEEMNIDNRLDAVNLTSQYMNAIKIADPSLSEEELKGKAKNQLLKNYTTVGGVLVRKSLVENNPNQVQYDSEEYYDDYRKLLAVTYLGDEDRYDEITIRNANNTIHDDRYNVVIENNDQPIAQTYMMKNSDGSIMSYKNYADSRANADESIKLLKAQKGRFTTTIKGTEYSNQGSEEMVRNINKEIKRLEDSNVINVKDYNLESVADTVYKQNALFGIEQSKSELENGYYTINGKQIPEGTPLTENQQRELAKQSIKRTQQKLNSKFGNEYKALPESSKNKIALDALRMKKDLSLQNSDVYSLAFNNEIENRKNIRKLAEGFASEVIDSDKKNSALTNNILSKAAYGINKGYNLALMLSTINELKLAEEIGNREELNNEQE